MIEDVDYEGLNRMSIRKSKRKNKKKTYSTRRSVRKYSDSIRPSSKNLEEDSYEFPDSMIKI